MKNTYKNYSAKHRAIIKKHINTLLKLNSMFILSNDDMEIYTITYKALESECRAFSKATGRLLDLPEFVKMFI